jgi:hypothetical protein
LRRTPTDSTPQWTKSTAPGVAATIPTTSATFGSDSEYRCIAGNRQTTRRPVPPSAERTRSAPSGATGLTMNPPTMRPGWRATAAATEPSSPGRLAISIDRPTPWRSISATQRSASASGEAGSSQPRRVQSSAALRVAPAAPGICAPSSSKKRLEKK